MLYRFGMLLCRGLLSFLRVRRRVTGLDNIPDDGGAVLAITHFGYLEFVLVAYSIWRHDRRRMQFLITAGAFRNPIVGFLLHRLGQIPVDRRAGASAYRTAVSELQHRGIIGIFPEAGIDPSFTVRTLKTGAVRLATEAGVPLIPVAIWGGQRLMTREHRVRFRERFDIPVRLSFGEPLPLDGERHEVSTRLRSALQRQVARLRAEYPDDGDGQWWQPRALGGTAPTPEEAALLDAAVQARREAKLVRPARGRRNAG